jgi:hypothetical protein
MAAPIEKTKLEMAIRNVRNLRYILELLESRHRANNLLVNFQIL